MTTTPHSPLPLVDRRPEPVPPPRRPMSPAVKVLLFVVAPLLVLAIVAALLVALWPTPVHADFRADGAAQTTVAVEDADIRLLASGDGEVHVEVTGWHSGSEPEFTVRAAGDETVVGGGCRQFLLSRCSLTVTVAVPSTADVRVTGTNGTITAERLSGELELVTSNGALRVIEPAGDLDLRTSNGSIQVMDATSARVSADTTNGQVELHFADAPDEAIARSTNGSITIRVPEGDAYFVDAQTTNGRVSSEVESDRFADSTLTAETSNGDISVVRTGG
jgi:Putative adhesin